MCLILFVLYCALLDVPGLLLMFRMGTQSRSFDSSQGLGPTAIDFISPREPHSGQRVVLHSEAISTIPGAEVVKAISETVETPEGPSTW